MRGYGRRMAVAIASWLGWGLLALSVAGSLYMLAAAAMLWRFLAPGGGAMADDTPVTLLKPLHGGEPRLAQNLATFLNQSHGGPVQMLCGVARADDSAVAAARANGAELIVDPARHGANGKIGNLVNMMPHARHPLLILSDSDMAVPPDYIARIVSALAQPGVGAVTCLYGGRGDAGFWSRLGAAGLSWQFLPGALFGIRTGLAQPCMGSTIALTRDTLERIGGFARFADVLADDHAIGAAVRELGLRVVIPPMLVTHASAESTFAELWRHELRWAVTVRGVAPAGHAGSVIGLPLPLGLLGLALAFSPAALGIFALALAVRVVVALAADGRAGARTAPIWLLPARDILSFAIFCASFFARSIDWRGAALRMTDNGRIVAAPETPR